MRQTPNDTSLWLLTSGICPCLSTAPAGLVGEVRRLWAAPWWAASPRGTFAFMGAFGFMTETRWQVAFRCSSFYLYPFFSGQDIEDGFIKDDGSWTARWAGAARHSGTGIPVYRLIGCHILIWPAHTFIHFTEMTLYLINRYTALVHWTEIRERLHHFCNSSILYNKGL